MSSCTRSLSRTLIAITVAASPVVALAPTAHAAPASHLPATPQAFLPAAPTVPAPVETTVGQEDETRWVNVPVANLRSGPGTSYRVVGTRTLGTAVTGPVDSDGWLKVSDKEYLAPSVVTDTEPVTRTTSDSSTPASQAGKAATMTVSANVASVRSGPGLTHRVVGSVRKGTEVKGTWTSNGWLDLGRGRFVAQTVLAVPASPGGTEAKSSTLSRWVSVPVANVRRGPSTTHAIVGTKTSGTEVRGVLVSNGWLKVSDTQYLAPSVLTSTKPATGTPGTSSQQVTRYVTAAVANVRSGAGLNHDVVGTMKLGAQVKGTMVGNDWLDLGNGRFLSALILSPTSPSPATPPAVQVVDRWVSVPVANVRSGPGTNYSVVATRTQGAKVSGQITSNGWLQMPGSQYMAPSVLSTTPPASNPAPAPAPTPPAPTQIRQALLNTAAQYVGSKYVLYGTPPDAFDCSSYTWWVYKQNGINIPKTVRDQRTIVTPVTNPQPGDLIFYKNYYHVGIYAGPGMSYEAQNPQAGVVYSRIWDKPENVWYGRVPGV